MANKKKRFIYYSIPEHWFQAALELNEAVEELYLIKEKAHFYQTFHFENQKTVKRPVLSRATYLLMFYALENLLKGNYETQETIINYLKTNNYIIDFADIKKNYKSS